MSPPRQSTTAKLVPGGNFADRDERRVLHLENIAHLGDLIEEDIAIPNTEDYVHISRPSYIDLLLEQSTEDAEQNLPYWAEVWPSGIALAAELAANPNIVRNRRVLELGCGTGITTALAVQGGADVIAADYAAESLSLTRLTCLDHTGQEPATLRVNWRDADDQQTLEDLGPFPMVLAADVLYERRDIEPLLTLIDRVLSPGGMFWLAHPRRNPAEEFVAEANERGLRGSVSTRSGPWTDPNDNGATVEIHRLVRPR